MPEAPPAPPLPAALVAPPAPPASVPAAASPVVPAAGTSPAPLLPSSFPSSFPHPALQSINPRPISVRTRTDGPSFALPPTLVTRSAQNGSYAHAMAGAVGCAVGASASANTGQGLGGDPPTSRGPTMTTGVGAGVTGGAGVASTAGIRAPSAGSSTSELDGSIRVLTVALLGHYVLDFIYVAERRSEYNAFRFAVDSTILLTGQGKADDVRGVTHCGTSHLRREARALPGSAAAGAPGPRRRS